jgi:hypothetical protein
MRGKYPPSGSASFATSFERPTSTIVCSSTARSARAWMSWPSLLVKNLTLFSTADSISLRSVRVLVARASRREEGRGEVGMRSTAGETAECQLAVREEQGRRALSMTGLTHVYACSSSSIRVRPHPDLHAANRDTPSLVGRGEEREMLARSHQAAEPTSGPRNKPNPAAPNIKKIHLHPKRTLSPAIRGREWRWKRFCDRRFVARTRENERP